MRTAVQQDHAVSASGMIILHVDAHGLRALNDLHNRALSKGRIEGKKRHLNTEAAWRLRRGLRVVIRVSTTAARTATATTTTDSPAAAATALALLCFGRQWRNFPVGW